MSAKDRILRRPLPTMAHVSEAARIIEAALDDRGMLRPELLVDRLAEALLDHEEAARSLSASSRATIARQAAEIATLKPLAGVPARVTVTPSPIGGKQWTAREKELSLALDRVIYRLERGGCSWPVRVWLGWRRRRLERAMEVTA